ncbi:MAG: hypothetical protein IKF53_02425 [Clostridia bacterium]|nr:hypothetical protein [Clostridia bacterium]
MINKGKVISVKSIKNINFFSKNRYLLILCFLYFIGVISSIILYSNDISIINFEYFFKTFYISRGNTSFYKVFLKSFLVLVSVLTVIFISGTSVMGVGLVPLFVYFIGYFMGGITGYLYVNYSLKGIAFNALLILLPSFILLLVVFIASKISLEYSHLLSKVVVTRTSVNNKTSFKSFCQTFLILTFVLIFNALLDAGLSAVFLKIFNLK